MMIATTGRDGLQQSLGILAIVPSFESRSVSFLDKKLSSSGMREGGEDKRRLEVVVEERRLASWRRGPGSRQRNKSTLHGCF